MATILTILLIAGIIVFILFCMQYIINVNEIKFFLKNEKFLYKNYIFDREIYNIYYFRSKEDTELDLNHYVSVDLNENSILCIFPVVDSKGEIESQAYFLCPPENFNFLLTKYHTLRKRLIRTLVQEDVYIDESQ